MLRSWTIALVVALVSACGGAEPSSKPPAAPVAQTKPDPLPSWNDAASKKAIVDFVGRVTREGGPDFVPAAERIATFDNDGTLWSEQPIYFQVAFAFDRVKAMAPKHPEWKQKQPFKAILEGDMKSVAAAGEKGLLEVMGATHAGNTTDEFAAIVTEWIGSAHHPKFKRPVYGPRLPADAGGTRLFAGERLQDLHRVRWRRRVHAPMGRPCLRDTTGAGGGSRAKVQYELRDGKPVLMRLAAIDLIDDKAGKPVGIHQVIGRRPIAAFGNSDGDFEMLEWTTSGSGPRFGLIVHHTDAEREWAYDRTSHVGQLARALDEAPKRGWVLADMKQDWKVIYPFQK